MYNSIVQILTIYLIQQSGAYYFIGNYNFKDIMSFMGKESSCGFIPWNISSNIEKEYPETDEFCMVFMKSVINYSMLSQLIKVDVRYSAFGLQYNFERTSNIRCASNLGLQKVEMVLLCQGKTVLNGTTCKGNEDCDRKKEKCQRHNDINLQICIPKRHIYESCDNDTQCDKNNICMSSGYGRICQCSPGYEEIDGHCIKVGLVLEQICTNDDQCSGTEYATQCLYNPTKQERVCSCRRGYISSGSKCIVDGLLLHEPCEDSQQCTGTTNAKNCKTKDNQMQPVCSCNDGYIEKYEKCLRMNLRLFESCDWSEQCAGAYECKVIEEEQICYCPDGKEVIGGTCLKARIVLGENCFVSAQCTGTSNAGVCMVDHHDYTTLVCQCDSGYIRYNDACLQVNKTLYEDCEIDYQCKGTSKEEVLVCRKIGHRKLCLCHSEYVVDNKYLKCRKVGLQLFQHCVNNRQCSGTENAGNCTEIGNNTLCFCQDEYLDFKGRCISGYKEIDEECEANIQCTGSEHAGVCGENQTCTCDMGFIRLEEGCVQGNLTLGQPCVHDIQCSGTENAGICLGGMCFCDQGFNLHKLQCLPAKGKKTWLSEKENQLIVIAAGGWFCMIACSVTTIYFALKRRKAETTREERCNSTRLPTRNIADNTADGVNQQSYIYDRAENIYKEEHQLDQDEETVNVYSVSEPQCFQRAQDSDNDTYNHLQQKPLQMSDDVNMYGVPKFTPVASSRTMQENTL